MPAKSGAARTQVGVNIRAAEGIDGLFGVTDHKQTTVVAIGFNLIKGIEDAVLKRIGVLKLVDQRYWKLTANNFGQT